MATSPLRPHPQRMALKMDGALEAEDLLLLARRYAAEEMFDEAVHLYEMCLKLRPHAEALERELDSTLAAQRASEKERRRDLEKEIRDQRAGEELDCSQYLGLARYYIGTDQSTKAIELLEIAKLRSPNNFLPYGMVAGIHFADGEWELARGELEHARRINPFESSLAEMAGRVEFELGNNQRSLQHFIDAFLLTAEKRGEAAGPIRRMIITLERAIGIDHSALLRVIHEQLHELASAAERLAVRKENLFRLESRKVLEQIFEKVHRDAEKRGNLIALSAELRDIRAFHHLRDEGLLRLARFTKVESFAEGDHVCREGDRSFSFYVVKSGGFSVQRETPVGTQIFATAGSGQILGEMNFLDRTVRSADIVATAPSTVFAFAFSAVEQVSEQERETAVALHWAFWRSLTEKLRDANDHLRTFFPQSEGAGDVIRGRHDDPQLVQVERRNKMSVFEERGLSAAEMRLLATFSTDERFRSGAAVFREGETGEALYIVMDGQVRISKLIPGVGEEALAILGRGDFFGEMALIDRQPRSADAWAHGGDATVLMIDRGTLEEVLSLDPRAALQFLNLLCRMISSRLREINDKIVHWKCMSGGF